MVGATKRPCLHIRKLGPKLLRRARIGTWAVWLQCPLLLTLIHLMNDACFIDCHFYHSREGCLELIWSRCSNLILFRNEGPWRRLGWGRINIPEGDLGSKATGGEASGLGCTGRAPSCLE